MEPEKNFAQRFAAAELVEAGEEMRLAEREGPFVAALVELADGGYVVRVAQPRVIHGGRQSRLADVYQLGPWGPSGYAAAARRLYQLIDDLG